MPSSQVLGGLVEQHKRAANVDFSMPNSLSETVYPRIIPFIRSIAISNNLFFIVVHEV